MKRVAVAIWDHNNDGWFVRLERGDNAPLDSLPPCIAGYDEDESDDEILKLIDITIGWEYGGDTSLWQKGIQRDGEHEPTWL
ncbi:MAG: hypothetical protein EOM01_08495 [Spirochaetia bacterium]|nr:hypothetical protein [Spirochaetia bacterium]